MRTIRCNYLFVWIACYLDVACMHNNGNGIQSSITDEMACIKMFTDSLALNSALDEISSPNVDRRFRFAPYTRKARTPCGFQIVCYGPTLD
jgi:hypothetical protein